MWSIYTQYPHTKYQKITLFRLWLCITHQTIISTNYIMTHQHYLSIFHSKQSQYTHFSASALTLLICSTTINKLAHMFILLCEISQGILNTKSISRIMDSTTNACNTLISNGHNSKKNMFYCKFNFEIKLQHCIHTSPYNTLTLSEVISVIVKNIVVAHLNEFKVLTKSAHHWVGWGRGKEWSMYTVIQLH